MSKLHEFQNQQELNHQLTERITSCLMQDIEQSGSALMAVSGGSSPKDLFVQLRSVNLDWGKVTIVLVDERWVSPSHMDSNEAMVRTNLLQGFAASAHFIGWASESNSVYESAAEANKKFQQLTLPFSVIILGMGTDGHTASWFLDAPEFSELISTRRAAAVCTSHPTEAAHARLTLNLSAVMQSKAIFLQIKGDAKKTVLDSAKKNSATIKYPISLLLNDDSNLEVFWSAI